MHRLPASRAVGSAWGAVFLSVRCGSRRPEPHEQRPATEGGISGDGSPRQRAAKRNSLCSRSRQTATAARRTRKATAACSPW